MTKTKKHFVLQFHDFNICYIKTINTMCENSLLHLTSKFVKHIIIHFKKTIYNLTKKNMFCIQFLQMQQKLSKHSKMINHFITIMML